MLVKKLIIGQVRISEFGGAGFDAAKGENYAKLPSPIALQANLSTNEEESWMNFLELKIIDQCQLLKIEKTIMYMQ